MSYTEKVVLTEADRLKLLDLKTEYDSLEYLLSGGGLGEKSEYYLERFKVAMNAVNELKRELLLDAGQLEDSYEYTYYFDTVAGVIWVDDAE
jgi:hypothetical protein